MNHDQSRNRATIYTIGHSNLTGDEFVLALRAFEIELVVDVRSTPFSRHNPQFNRDALQVVLQAAGIEYWFAGDSLGGRPNDSTCYRNGRLPEPGSDFLRLVDYAEVARRPWFRRGAERLNALARQSRTAIMCSEENPNQCHRAHLIARNIVEVADVVHIRTRGNAKPWLEAHEQAPTQAALL